MELDRGTLAKIDRKVLSGLDHDESYQMVRVPVSEAMWSTWRRYSDALGISMGRAIIALIERELVSVFGHSTGEGTPVFEGRAEEQLAARQTQITTRERHLEAAEERLRGWTERLRIWERELQTLEERIQFASKLAARPREASGRSVATIRAHADRA